MIGADAAAKISGARREVWDHDGDVKYPRTHRWYRGEAIKLWSNNFTLRKVNLGGAFHIF